MLKHLISIREELRVHNIDAPTLRKMTDNFIYRISEYKNYILDNINYNTNTNKIEYKGFDNIDVKVIMRELWKSIWKRIDKRRLRMLLD